jgi:hypothetical protein
MSRSLAASHLVGVTAASLALLSYHVAADLTVPDAGHRLRGTAVAVMVMAVVTLAMSRLLQAGPDYRIAWPSIIFLLALSVAAAWDVASQEVPDSVWIFAVLGWCCARLAGYVPEPDPACLLIVTGALLAAQLIAAGRDPGLGGADVLAFLTSVLFLAPAHTCSAVAVASGMAIMVCLGGHTDGIPYLPFYLCGVCIVRF